MFRKEGAEDRNLFAHFFSGFGVFYNLIQVTNRMQWICFFFAYLKLAEMTDQPIKKR